MTYPVLAASDTWFTQGGTTVARSSIENIEIVSSYNPTGNEDASWDASAAKDGSVMAYVDGTKLTIAGNGYGKVFMNPDSSWAFSDHNKSDYFNNVTTIANAELLDSSNATTFMRLFQSCEKLTTVNVSNWDTSNVTSMHTTFSQCYALTTVDVSNWNTSKVTSMVATFQVAKSLESLDLSKWDVSNVTSMQNMFGGTEETGQATMLVSIGNVGNWSTGKVENMKNMFNGCKSLAALDVSKWNTSSVKDMSGMFCSCTSLEELDVSDWNVSKATNMKNMFYDCPSLKELDVSKWNTGACTNMQAMFRGCISLEELDVATKVVNAGTENVYTAWNVSKVTTFANMFSCGNDYGQVPMKIKTLDVSAWDTSSATDMSFMFYGCQGPGSIDVSGWDVSKVATFDHMFAHSYLTIGDTSGWKVSTACTNLNGLFHTVQNTKLNVSGFDTSKVTIFEQMFEFCGNLTEIVGLEKFGTSSGLGFSEMFHDCSSLTELDLSSFDTTKAKDDEAASPNGAFTATSKDMFLGMNMLEKITLGEKFSFNGDGSCAAENVGILPAPNSNNIPGADGNWYDMNGNAIAPSAVSDKTFGVYYATPAVAEEDMNQMVLVKKGSLMRTAAAIRTKSRTVKGYEPAEFAEKILSIE